MAGMFEYSMVTEVQRANDIVDVIGEHVSLKRKGREMVGLCPFHDDHRPSMSVSGVKQIFKCFACGAGGDVFKFVQMRENLSFPQAIERLAERAGITIRKINKRTPGKAEGKTEPEVDPNRLAKANAWAAKQFQKNLQDKDKGKFAREYLAKREISPDSIKKWQIGLAANSTSDLVSNARAQKASIELLEQAGLLVSQNQDKFVNRLMFTITDVTGRVVGFGGRTLDGTGAKYINSPTTVLFDKSNCLYGLEQARHEIVSSGTAIVVEGYTDVIMAHQAGCCNVVATLGTSFTAGHGRILRRYAKKVVLIFDGDVAGIEAANRALDVCLSQRIDIRLASVPGGKDPCDFILEAGREEFQKLVDEAVDVFEFKWDRLKEKFDSDDTLAGRRQAIEEYLQSIATGLHAGKVAAIDLGLRVNQISGIIGLEPRQINSELTRRIRQAARAAGYERAPGSEKSVDYGNGRFAAAQREVLEVLLNEPVLFDIAAEKITADMFDVPIFKHIAGILFEILEKDKDASLRDVLARVESVELSNRMMALAQAGEDKENFQARLYGALETIEHYQAQKKRGRPVEKDEREFLRGVHESTGREDRHNVGMV